MRLVTRLAPFLAATLLLAASVARAQDADFNFGSVEAMAQKLAAKCA